MKTKNGVRIKSYKMGTYNPRLSEAKNTLRIITLCMIISCMNFTNSFSIAGRVEDTKVIQGQKVEEVDYNGIPYMSKDKSPIPVEEVTDVSVEQQIRLIAREKGFKWEDYLVRLSKCESSLNPEAVNKNRNGSVDWGLFQFNSEQPPIEITKDCALNVRCSTEKAIEAINMGKQNHWVCDKKIR